ncbi:unnamed protein product [Malus baccata var. baccata]
MDLCPSIKNILLDSEGKCVAVKYFLDDWPTNGAKFALEKSSEIMMFVSNVVIYKFVQDLHIFLTGGDDENELILATILQGFFDVVTHLLRNNIDKREALENLDLILLYVLIASYPISSNLEIYNQILTITQAWVIASEHLTRTLLK